MNYVIAGIIVTLLALGIIWMIYEVEHAEELDENERPVRHKFPVKLE